MFFLAFIIVQKRLIGSFLLPELPDQMSKDVDSETNEVADHLFSEKKYKTTVDGDKGKASAESSSREKSKEDAMDQYENMSDD